MEAEAQLQCADHGARHAVVLQEQVDAACLELAAARLQAAAVLFHPYLHCLCDNARETREHLSLAFSTAIPD